MDNLINQQQEYGCFNSTDILHISFKAIKLTLVIIIKLMVCRLFYSHYISSLTAVRL